MKATVASLIASGLISVILMFVGVFVKDKNKTVNIATFLLLALLGVTIYELLFTAQDSTGLLFNNMLRIDKYGLWFNVLMTSCLLIYVLFTRKDIIKVGIHAAEYYSLLFFIMCGVYLMSSYYNLLILFLGIEIMSIPQYILAGSDKKSLKSSEASLKYLLMGAFTTGIFLMGIALLYGATGSFAISYFSVLQADTISPLALSGIILILIAFCFKVSAAPMHFWTPDVYDGSPTPFAAFMATIVKASIFFGFLRLFHISFGTVQPRWEMAVAIIIALTLLIGNITAVFQQSVKRMLAYSSIAQAGFMLFAIIAVLATSWQAIILYAVAYTLATIGLFAVLMKLKDYTYDGFNGLAKSEPLVAFCASIFLFSLAGIPLTAGFMAKYKMLYALVQQGNLMWLVLFALLMAAVSVYYYFRVIIAMYFKKGEPELVMSISQFDKIMLCINVLLIVAIGIFPDMLTAFI